ncbi:MAG: TonB-dependent receptor [Bacteroidota bacterium]
MRLLLLPLLLLAVAAEAQTGAIAGQITEAASGDPLEGATVAVAGTTLGAATEADGRYRIERVPAGAVAVRVSFVGFAPRDTVVTVQSGGTVRLDVALAEAGDALGEVAVESDAEAESIRESPFAVSIVDGQQLAGRGLTVDEAIARVAGVQVRRSGGLGSASVFSIRGLEGQRVQIYVNGNAADVAGDAFTLDNIPLQLVERVEVYKGVVPAQFGGDGLGSAINVVTIHPPAGYLDAGVTLGSFGQQQISVTGLRPLGLGFEAGASVNVDRAENDYVMENPFQPGLVVRRDHDRIERTLVGTKVVNDRAWFDELGVEAALISERREVQGIQTNIQQAESRSNLGVIVLTGERDGALGGRLSLRTALIGLWARGSLVDTSAVRFGWDGTTRPSPNGRGEIGFFPSDSDSRTTLYRYRIASAFRASSAHTINLSGIFDRTAFRPSNPIANEFAGRNVADFPGDQSSAVVGISHEWRPLGERFIAVTGARGYAYSASGTPSALFNLTTDDPERVESQSVEAGASLALRYRLGDGVLAKAAIENARRLPSSAELFGDGLLVQASPSLQPERAVNLTLGAQLDQRFGGRRIQAEVSGFYQEIRNLIRLGVGVGGSASHTNLGAARIAGVEAEVQGDVTSWLFARAYGTFLDARDVLETQPGTSTPNPTNGLRIPNLPYLFGGLQAEGYRDGLLGRRSRAKVFYEGQYTGEYFYAFEVSQRQERRIPRAITHTVGAEVAWLDTGLTLSAEVQNLTDATVLNQFNLPLPGRVARLKLRYTLVGSR